MELYINLEILEWTNNKELNKDISVVKRKEFLHIDLLNLVSLAMNENYKIEINENEIIFID
ncbi:MAG: hypothetical protein ACRCZ0_04225 [Cetobacterium sp.]